MTLTSLNLANYRGYEQLDISFESDVTVIAGVNGVGKSSLLTAIATILSRSMSEWTPSRSTALYFTDDDIHDNEKSLEVSLQLAMPDQTIDVGLQRLRGTKGESDRLMLLRQEQKTYTPQSFAHALTSRTLTGDIEAGMQETRRVLQELKTQTNPTIAVYFSPKRQLPGQPRTLPAVKPFDVSKAFSLALHDREVELREFMHWFRVQEILAEEGDANRLRVLDKLREVIHSFVPEFTNLRIEEFPRLGLVVEKAGRSLYLHQLSDGERGLLAMVFDLTRRLSIANPESKDPLAEGQALVMIDEIELHLHPKWQRGVLNQLRQVFPRCQFVVTTHSPMVLGETEARCIRFLDFEEGRIRVTIPLEAYGMDANRVLHELMDAPIRNKIIQEKLNELFNLIDEEDFVASKALLTTLSEQLGVFDPELTRASALMHFLEGDE